MSDQTRNHDADTNPPHRGPREDAGTVEVERVTEVTEHAGSDKSLVEAERVRAEPRALEAAGFTFEHPDLETALRAELDRPA